MGVVNWERVLVLCKSAMGILTKRTKVSKASSMGSSVQVYFSGSKKVSS